MLYLKVGRTDLLRSALVDEVGPAFEEDFGGGPSG